MSLPLIIQLLYAAFCVLLAGINYWIIEVKQWKVKHFYNGLAHVIIWTVLFFCFHIHWLISLTLPFIARDFFDFFLNLFRGKPINYVSLKPKSIADRIEKSIFGLDGVTPKIVWIAIVIIINVVYDFYK